MTDPCGRAAPPRVHFSFSFNERYFGSVRPYRIAQAALRRVSRSCHSGSRWGRGPCRSPGFSDRVFQNKNWRVRTIRWYPPRRLGRGGPVASKCKANKPECDQEACECRWSTFRRQRKQRFKFCFGDFLDGLEADPDLEETAFRASAHEDRRIANVAGTVRDRQ